MSRMPATLLAMIAVDAVTACDKSPDHADRVEQVDDDVGAAATESPKHQHRRAIVGRTGYSRSICRDRTHF